MTKPIWFALMLIAASIVCAVLEQVFYGGRLDADNIVQESFFLPLSFILLFAGIILLVLGLIHKLLKRRQV